ncbi:hypothetical protein AGR7A_pAt20030 [Agrobacterium deltaense NCPPB 1641]|uniref:Uncharacterized protein n=1 Tax=Agrobacterium deltaense NCPPB 1641 TaxID=1183425 RepID=A0A1S7U7W0_9HYPH|nr:hypothetical protein AGR7A_pAt20030 [Agrobacterium deltaense NCPPB 1641]
MIRDRCAGIGTVSSLQGQRAEGYRALRLPHETCVSHGVHVPFDFDSRFLANPVPLQLR